MSNIISDQAPLPPEFEVRLRYARETLREMSQKVLAEKSELPPSSIAHFEAGNRKPSFDNLKRLASALSVTTDFLLGRVADYKTSTESDPLYRHIASLTDENKKLAGELIKVLAGNTAR